MSKRKYSDNQVTEAVANSTSFRQVLNILQLKEAGGNYRCIQLLIHKLNLSTTHFLGQGHNKGKRFGPKRPIEDYLSNRYEIQSHKLRLRLLSEGYFEHKCYNCSLTTWLGKPIPIELEHKDGNHFNNNLDNLTLLCPNCHSLTPTYRRSKPKT